jgi:hypothetical protein
MTFANRFLRGATLGVVAMGLTLGVANAQNGSNYHVLNNSPEGAFLGIGAGATQTDADGIGVWVRGEDMKGSIQVDFGAFGGLQFSYRNIKFRESLCLFNPGPSTGTINYQFDALLFTEFDGMNGNVPVVFTNPVCSTPIGSVAAPYGVYGTTSFVLFGMPSGIGGTGVPTSTLMLAPNSGINLNGGAGPGTATIVAAAGGVVSNNLAQSGCYLVQFTWLPTSVNYLDKIDGMWHWLRNSDEGNQYWLVSTDEMSLWQSNTFGTDAGVTMLYTLPAFIDYGFHLASVEANTTASLATNGYSQNGPYYTQTENMAPTGTVGFDVGRGSSAISFNGSGGVKTTPAFGGLGNGNQDPAYGGKPAQLGFVTWNNKPSAAPAGFGGTRLTWLSIDYGGAFGFNPSVDLNITKLGGTVRVPMLTNPPAGGPIQSITTLAFGFFQHPTGLAASGWPDPDGITSGAFGVNPSAGGSFQFPTLGNSGFIPCNLGIAINLTYGTSGLNPGLVFDPTTQDVSGTKQLFLHP